MKKNGEVLMEKLDAAVMTGEVPYQANRRALRAFDVQEDVDAGMKEVEVVVSGADALIADLQEVENAARNIARNAASFL